MALLKEKEENEGKDNDKGSAENSSPDTSSSSSSSNSSASFDPASLTGEQLKTAAKYLSGMSLLSNASASPAKSNPDAKCAQGSIVRRLQNYFAAPNWHACPRRDSGQTWNAMLPNL